MIRIGVICEGQTESSFVNRCLAPYCLQEANVLLIPRLLAARSGRHRGGHVTVERLAEAVYCDRFQFDCVTTLVDFYGFQDAAGRGKTALEEDIRAAVIERNPDLDPRNVLPYVQMHEFEALLFSDVTAFELALCERWTPEVKSALLAVADEFPHPEAINNSPETAPSKRLKRLIPRYDKILDGVLVAEAIGVDAMRRRCPLFDGWMEKLMHWVTP